MLPFTKNKRIANIVINDHVIRMVENNGKDLNSIRTHTEKPIPTGIIRNGAIKDELAFYDLIKTCVKEWGIANRQVRFYVPHDLVIMKEITFPEDVEPSGQKAYMHMEIGNTIHFPFANPVFDLFDYPVLREQHKAIAVAAPENEIIKYTEVLEDARLHPVAIDIQPLGVYRYFYNLTRERHPDKVFLFLELGLTSANISIFNRHQLEFLRFQPLNMNVSDWKPNDAGKKGIYWNFTGDESVLHSEIQDQLSEIQSLMNFYRYSIHNGEQSITDIVLLGDYPYLDDAIAQVTETYDVTVTGLSTKKADHASLSPQYIPALGLALKGATIYDS